MQSPLETPPLKCPWPAVSVYEPPQRVGLMSTVLDFVLSTPAKMILIQYRALSMTSLGCSEELYEAANAMKFDL